MDGVESEQPSLDASRAVGQEESGVKVRNGLRKRVWLPVVAFCRRRIRDVPAISQPIEDAAQIQHQPVPALPPAVPDGIDDGLVVLIDGGVDRPRLLVSEMAMPVGTKIALVDPWIDVIGKEARSGPPFLTGFLWMDALGNGGDGDVRNGREDHASGRDGQQRPHQFRIFGGEVDRSPSVAWRRIEIV